MHFACRHIMSDGVRCHAPAMRASNFCYYHTKNRFRARIGAMEDCEIPIPEDKASIRTSIAQTLNALISKRIDAKTAGLVIYGLQLALHSVPKGICLPPDSVRDMTQSGEGDELAPAECVHPGSDCSGCSRTDTCEHCEIDPEEDFEEEEEDQTDSALSESDSRKLVQAFVRLKAGG